MRLRALWRNLFGRDRVDAELDEELRAYRDMLADEQRAAGVPAGAARRHAALALGGLEQVKEEVRAVRAGALVEQLVQDVRYGARVLRAKPAFTLVAAVTLAVGIGANTAIFSVVNAVLLRPLPYAEPDRLFAITGMSYTGEFVELQRRARTFDVAAFVPRQVTITGDGDPLRLPAAAVSPNLMTLLGAHAAAGRPLRDGDERAADGAVVAISHRLWQSRFGGDPRVVGRRISVDGDARTIVGVMPAEFAIPAAETELWVPSAIDLGNRIALWSTARRMLGRLRPGMPLAQAEAEVRAIAPTLRELFPWSMPAEYGTGAGVLPLKESLVSDSRAMLLMLLGAAAVVLLIACVNVSNLLVARTLARQRELAIRASLGAARGRILRQVLTEGALLVALGVALGAPLALAGIRLLAASLPADLGRPVMIAVDWRLLGFGVAAVAACGALVAIVPALRASRVDLVPRLAEGGRSGQSRRTRWTSNLLIGAQAALAVTLVIAAVLLVRTLGNLHAVAPGFAADNVVAARVSPPDFRFGDAAVRRDLYTRILERVAALPGVTAAAVTDRLPFGGDAFGSVFVIEGRPNPAVTGEWPLADIRGVVSHAFFSALDIPVLEGRAFTPGDTDTSQPVVIISESLARTYWPGESAVGRRLAAGAGRQPMRTIVGVVADVKWEHVTETPQSALFLPLSQADPGAMRVVLRTTADEAAALAHIRGVVASIDRDIPVDRASSLRDLLAGSVDQPRFAAALVGWFAVAGLLLGAIGIYGTVADHVAQRRRDIGVRMALGARSGDVLRAVLGGTLLVVAAGALAGVAAAVFVTRLFATMLYGITPTDPVTFASAVLLLALAALLGAYLPARRAAALDPLTVLRAD